jgi:hypothetical protein
VSVVAFHIMVMVDWWNDMTITQVWQWQNNVWRSTQEDEEGAELWGGRWWKQLQGG